MDLDRRRTEPLVAVVAVATLPLGVVIWILLSFPHGAVVFVVGWFLVIPILGVLGDQEAEATGDEWAAEDPLETLRHRYAAGALTDEEFDAKLQRLVATEAIPEEAIQPESTDAGPAGYESPDVDRESARER